MSEARRLSSLAMRDAIHDFGTIATELWSVIAESLPGLIDNIATDKQSLEYATNAYTQLGGKTNRPIAILCDASMCANFVNEVLVKNTIGPVIIIKNHETANDCGSNCKDEKYTKSGVKIAYESELNEDVKYDKYVTNSEITTKLTAGCRHWKIQPHISVLPIRYQLHIVCYWE